MENFNAGKSSFHHLKNVVKDRYSNGKTNIVLKNMLLMTALSNMWLVFEMRIFSQIA